MLPKINTGKELLELLQGVHGFEYEYENTNAIPEINFMTSIMGQLQEYVDYLSDDTDVYERMKTIPELVGILNQIEEHKFGLFGEKKVKTATVYGQKFDDWLVGTFYLMKLDNPNVVPINRNS